MRLNNKLLLFVIFVLFCSFSSIHAQEILKVQEVEPGMQGVGRTVFKGYQVEEFPVEIIDVMEEQELNKSLILIKVSGDKIEEAGGIAAGMSGSPVYIDGKLIGAIGYGWQNSKHNYGVVTPIEYMLKLFDNEDSINIPSIKEGSPVETKTPLFISGLSGRALKRFEKDFSDYGFKVMSAGSSNRSKALAQTSLQSGSAVAVQLARGDISISSIGTLTYKDGDNILAFGHPFFNKGDVNYLLSKAYINGVIPSNEQPFKLGTPHEKLLGEVNIDRGAGIVGKLKEYPKIIPLRIKVRDNERGYSNDVNVQLVKDEDILTSLVTNVGLQSIDSTLDRIGKGTAKVKFTINGRGLPDRSVERENIFYSRQDIAATALYELYQYVNVITNNPFKDINFVDIQVDIEIENSNKVALVQEAKVLNKEIKPGDTLEIEVTLHPYRDKTIVKKVFIDLPEDISPGRATLIISGGFTGESYPSIPEEELNNQQQTNQAIVDGYKDFESIINDYLEAPTNNQLIVQIYPSYAAPEPPGNGKDIEKEDEKELNPAIPVEETSSEIKDYYKTDYVLEGNLSLDIKIEEKNKTEK
ncbi:MAG: SpoIVB peptidase S55 domain-containing protein [Halothermotrichaceae bacterium]